jgi:hypothetical protein
MNRGSVRAIVVIPYGLQRDLLAGQTVPVQVLLDGDNANTATTVMGYALTILQSESSKYRMVAGVMAVPRSWPCRASGTTRNSAARSSWYRVSSPTS